MNTSSLLKLAQSESFFFQLTNLSKELESIESLNDLKPKDEDLNVLKDEILKVSELIKLKDKNEFIKLLPIYYNKFVNMKQIPNDNSTYAKRIKKIFNEYNGTKKLTLKMISLKYEKLFNEKISLMTISRVLKNNLHMHYRKTKLKNPKLGDKDYILMTFLFLKTITQSLKLGFDFIYLDETGICLNNNNLKMWRKDKEEILGGPKNNGNKKINLILAIDKSEIIYGQYYLDSTITSVEFEDFLKEVLKRLKKEDLKKYVFILDNAKYHCTKNIKKFVKDNELKFLFCVPYKSQFNAIELVFNLLKNNIYNSQFGTMTELKKKVDELINDDKNNEDVKKVYKITLEEYLGYLINNSDNYDLNSFKVQYTQKKRKRQKKI